MQPLVQSFTKNLSGCNGCGQIKPLTKGENVTFIVQVQVEAEDGRAAANQIPTNLVVMGVTKMNVPQQNVTGSTFQRTSTQTVPAP